MRFWIEHGRGPLTAQLPGQKRLVARLEGLLCESVRPPSSAPS